MELQSLRSLSKPSPANERSAVSGATRADGYTGYIGPVAPAFQRVPPSRVLGFGSLISFRGYFGSGALGTFPTSGSSEDRRFRVKLYFEFV